MNKEFINIYNYIDSEISEAVSDYKNPFHLFCFANLSEESPNIRTVVLRNFSMSKKIFEFHSDIRSPKINQLSINPNFSALFYNREKKYNYDFLEQLKYYTRTYLQKKDGREYLIHRVDVI